MRFNVGVLAAGAVLVLSGCTSGSATQGARSGDEIYVHGNVDTEPNYVRHYQLGQVCQANPQNFGDMVGTKVIIEDENGKTIGITRLGQGVFGESDFLGDCAFPFALTVSGTHPFYRVSVDGYPGVEQYTKAELSQDLTLHIRPQ